MSQKCQGTFAVGGVLASDTSTSDSQVGQLPSSATVFGARYTSQLSHQGNAVPPLVSLRRVLDHLNLPSHR